MASLLSVANQAWLQLGGGKDESRLTLGEVIATTKNEYAWQMLQKAWREKREDGMINISSDLATQEILPVKDNAIDLSKLNIMRGVPDEMWLMNVGGLTCQCEYVKSTVNRRQLLCDDDTGGDTIPYVVLGDKIIFPEGAKATELPIIFANNGKGLDGDMIIDDAIAGILRRSIIEIYQGKTTPEDTTNNSNSNT